MLMDPNITASVTTALHLLGRIAVALEAIAKKAEPSFKTFDEIERERKAAQRPRS